MSMGVSELRGVGVWKEDTDTPTHRDPDTAET